MKSKKIDYKISVTPARNMCDYEDSHLFVKNFKISAKKGEKEIGVANGYIFNMRALAECNMLDILDDTETTDRLFCSLYHSTPLNADIESMVKGFKPECLEAINENFECSFDSVDDHDDAWFSHYDITIGFLDSVDVRKEYRGLGIGSKMMNMLKRFRNTVDFMFLQSYPGEVYEELRDLKISYDEEDQYLKTDAGKKQLMDGQLNIDKFYSSRGYKPFKVDGWTWMVIDKQGLKTLEKESKKEIQTPSFDPC
ncbi:GNAT family N-acetyltransferase [Pseudomonas serbica]|uniref:GNAT family N-acetyltransferase n=1 Tax=Pseudomonas serbica TaxID=2965074 RepID=UPI00237B89B0|nr:GNAT family N-acetyltransferase [Pseudomonas serbica]